MREINTMALIQLKAYRNVLTVQQYKTLRIYINILVFVSVLRSIIYVFFIWLFKC